MGLNGLTGTPLQALVFTTAGFAFLLFGYDQGVMGGLVSLDSFNERFRFPSAGLLGFMVASYDLGCMSGAIGAFLSGDRLSRRRTIVLACLVLMVGATLQASAYSRAQFIVGRVVAGFGTGCNSVTVPVLAAECARASRRGVLVVIEITMVIMGVVISNFTNFGFVFGCPSLNGKEAQWRVPIALQMIFPFFVFALMPFTVESPRWLAARGRADHVAIVLARLRGQGATPETDSVRAEADKIIQTAAYEAEISTSWKECFEMGELQNFRRLVLASAIGVMHQATGINSVVYYAPVIFSQVGLSTRTSYIMSCVASVCFLIGSALPVLFIERVGRRRTMIMGAALCGACMGIIACCVGVGDNFPRHKDAAGWAATAFVLVFQFSFGIGWNSMCWLYASEVGSLRMRSKTSSGQCTCNWATNFLTVMVAPTGFATLAWKFYLIWMSITLATIPVLYLFYPETAGRTLEQMDDFFRQYPQWNVADVANIWVQLDAGGASCEAKDVDSVQVESKEVAA